jgi:cation transport ATPase
LFTGSLSTDGLLVVRTIAAAENSTPARIAQLAAEAQVGFCKFIPAPQNSSLA